MKVKDKQKYQIKLKQIKKQLYVIIYQRIVFRNYIFVHNIVVIWNTRVFTWRTSFGCCRSTKTDYILGYTIKLLKTKMYLKYIFEIIFLIWL